MLNLSQVELSLWANDLGQKTAHLAQHTPRLRGPVKQAHDVHARKEPHSYADPKASRF